MARTFVVAAIAAALGLVLWLLLSVPQEPAEPPLVLSPNGTEGAALPIEPDPELAGARAAAGPSRSPGSASRVGPVPVLPGPVPDRSARNPRRGFDPQREVLVAVALVGPDGLPVPRARVTLVQAGYSAAFLALEGAGRAAMNLGRGRLRLEVCDARSADDKPLPLGWATLEVDEIGEAPIEVRLPPELAVTGHVRGPRGEAVAGARLTAEPVREVPIDYRGGHFLLESVALSADDGSFRIGGLGAGDVELVVKSPAAYRTLPRRTVQAGVQGLEVSLERAAPATVTVLDPEGRPVHQAEVAAQPGKRRPPADPACGGGAVMYGADNLTDTQGRYHVPGLEAAATYRLEIRPPRGRTHLKGAVLDEWEPNDVTVRLTSGRSIRGAVRDSQGRPVPHAHLYWRKAGKWRSGDVREDGTFSIDGLEAGDYRLRATVAADSLREDVADDPYTAEATAQAGAEDVVLTLDPGVELVVRVTGWPAARGFVQGELRGDGLRGGRVVTLSSHVYPDGILRWRGLEPQGSYSLWIPPAGSDASLIARGLRAGSGTIPLALEPGRSIRGQVKLPGGAPRAYVGVAIESLGFRVHSHAEPDGRYEILGLPPGTIWRVLGVVDIGERRYEAHADDIPAGGTADLDLTTR